MTKPAADGAREWTEPSVPAPAARSNAFKAVLDAQGSLLRRLLGTPVCGQQDLKLIVEVVYRLYLGRVPDPGGELSYVQALRRGMSVTELVHAVVSSPEFQQRYRVGGGAPPGPAPCVIMGTNIALTEAMWRTRAGELAGEMRSPAPLPPLRQRRFRHCGDYDVTAIASLYKGRRFIETFLDNITQQTHFHRSELIIIDACSPEGEEEVISRYMEVYDNIVYRRINMRVGIYDAWNEGVRLARGRYLTNTNLDDLRRVDALELQAAALDRNPHADVVYGDVYYSLDPEMSFDQVAAMGYRSSMRQVTAQSLIQSNWPHNAPMWRRRLHDEVGQFDPSFRSAGDHEFWLRCVEHGKQFLKLEDALVVYYHNPQGISTVAGSAGWEEGQRIQQRFSRRLLPLAAIAATEQT